MARFLHWKWNWTGYGVVLGVLFLVLPLAWFAWGYEGARWFSEWICKGRKDCNLTHMGQVGDLFGGVNSLFQALALGAVALSTDLARRSYQEERQRAHDLEFLAQAKQSYQWAFERLGWTGDGFAPNPDRLNWIVAARHIERAHSIGLKIQNPTYRLVLDEQTEYWRGQFYRALDFPVHIGWQYFSGQLEQIEGVNYPTENIDPLSAQVLGRFAAGKQDAKDPLDSVNVALLIQDIRGLGGTFWRALGDYIRHLHASRQALYASQLESKENIKEQGKP